MAGPTQDGGDPAVPVVEAAARLGVAPETLRKRLWRGQVPGEKRDGQWYVILSEPPPTPPAAVPDEQDTMQDRPGLRQDQEQDDAGPIVLVAELRDRVAFLEAAL